MDTINKVDIDNSKLEFGRPKVFVALRLFISLRTDVVKASNSLKILKILLFTIIIISSIALD